jgi:hypothetical protein
MANAECTNPVRGFISQRRYYFNSSFQFRITDIGVIAVLICVLMRNFWPSLADVVTELFASCDHFLRIGVLRGLCLSMRAPRGPGRLLSFEKFHHEITGAILRSNVVELVNVRMIQGRDGPGLAFHALLQLRRRRKMRSENLDCYSVIQADVPGAIYLAHPARAQGETGSHMDRFRTRREGQGWVIIWRR